MSRSKKNFDFLIQPDGTYPESISDLKGIKGSQGPKGSVGKGIKGSKGSEGTAPAAGVTAHVNFSGVTSNGVLDPSEIYSVYGIASVEKVSTGRYLVTYDVAFTGAQDYTVLCTPGYSGIGISTGVSATVVAQTATTTEIIVERGDNGNQFDSDTVQLVAYGTGDGGQVVQKGEKGDAGGQKGEKGREVKGEEGDKGQKGLKGLMPVGAAQAHVAFDASAGNGFNYATDVSSQFNVSNIVRNDEGDFTITWDSAFADANYTIVGSAGGRNHSGVSAANRAVNVLSRTATECQILVEAGGGSNQDAEYIAICVYGTGSQGNVQTGPKGLKGDKGARVGEKGSKGPLGPKGNKGVKGQVPAGAVTAHIAFNGEASNGLIGGVDLYSSFGVSSLIKNSTGDYTVTFTNPFDSANAYTVTGSAGGDNFTASSRTLTPRVLNAESCNFLVERSDSGAQDDVPYVSLVFYGSGTGGAAFVKGDQGPKGAKGVKGDKGETGQKGEANDKGEKGVQGIPGQAAAKGDIGPKGEKGEANDKGQKGEANDKGEKGGKGDKGSPGTNGIDGTDGLKGDKGPGVGQKGEKGSQGSQGPKGVKGFIGQTGNIGNKGIDGKDGDKGQKGHKGSDGRDGSAVAKGDKGDQGPSVTGPSGPKGTKGQRGTDGVDGNKGEKGVEGTQVNPDIDNLLETLGLNGYGSQQQAIASGLQIGDIFFDTGLTVLTTVK